MPVKGAESTAKKWEPTTTPIAVCSLWYAVGSGDIDKKRGIWYNQFSFINEFSPAVLGSHKTHGGKGGALDKSGEDSSVRFAVIHRGRPAVPKNEGGHNS